MAWRSGGLAILTPTQVAELHLQGQKKMGIVARYQQKLQNAKLTHGRLNKSYAVQKYVGGLVGYREKGIHI